MGIFDNVENDRSDEVRINVSERESSRSRSTSSSSDSKLKNEVSSELTDTDRSSGRNREVSLKDIHEQNEKIIELLKEIKAKDFNKSSNRHNRDSSSKNRVTSRGSGNDRNKGKQDDNDMAGGLDGVL